MSSAISLYKMKSLFSSLQKKIFRTHKSVSFKFCISFSAIKHNSSILFLAQALYNFAKSSLLKCKILGLPSARVKIFQIPHINFELISQFLFKFCIILNVMTQNSSVNFKVINFLLWIKGSHQSPNF